jgi:hypothetical protein
VACEAQIRSLWFRLWRDSEGRLNRGVSEPGQLGEDAVGSVRLLLWLMMASGGLGALVGGGPRESYSRRTEEEDGERERERRGLTQGQAHRGFTVVSKQWQSNDMLSNGGVIADTVG